MNKEKRALEAELLNQLKLQMETLESLLEKSESHWEAEDCFYRFYHQSFKVYSLQSTTNRIVAALEQLLPGRELNPDFIKIIGEGTGKKFKNDHNSRWHAETRPILEAYHHAKTMLQLGIKYGKELENPPQIMPSGWAAVLYLYNLR